MSLKDQTGHDSMAVICRAELAARERTERSGRYQWLIEGALRRARWAKKHGRWPEPVKSVGGKWMCESLAGAN